MGAQPLVLSSAAQAKLQAAMVAEQPLLIRSGLSAADAALLLREWEAFTAQDAGARYDMASHRGASRATLSEMWASNLRLVHDLVDSEVPLPNPVLTCLKSAAAGSVAAQAW